MEIEDGEIRHIDEYSFNLGKEAMLDKVCEWFENNVFSSEQLDRNYSDKLRKEMEG